MKGVMQRLPGDKALWAGLAGVVLTTIYAILFFHAEEEWEVMALLALVLGATYAGARMGFFKLGADAFADHSGVMNALVVAGAVVLIGAFAEDHFVLLLVATVLLFVLTCLGLNIQFGYAGMLNFAGAAFFGVGGYTAAVLTTHTGLPHLLILFIGGLMSALIGSVLILPVLRTSGHYAALITIAFGLLFKTFLEVNDALGGPQGLRVKGMNILGWDFNENIEIWGLEISFYVNYVAVILVLVLLAFAILRRLERSWIGLNLDSIRIDQTASACFGLNIIRWKITAFTLGNFFPGVAGAMYGMMVGFIAPTNYTFGDSLILVSIILLGGIGNPWGLIISSAILVVVPEKLQAIQEYRFFIFGIIVILILLFRPEGLIPRRPRNYFPGWRPK